MMDIANEKEKVPKSKGKKTKATMNYKIKDEEFKHPKTGNQIIVERREVRLNRNYQLRKNKMNDYILKKRGIIDSDGEASFEVSKNKSMSISNLTQLIDLTMYKIPPKVCALVALNSDCNLDALMKSFENAVEQNDNDQMEDDIDETLIYKINSNMKTFKIPGKIFKGKERITFIKTERDIYSILDTCKVVDSILFVSSCKKTDYTKWKTDPDKFSYSIDEFGYMILSMLRAQGLPEHLCLVQDLGFIPDKHQNDIKKLFQRYFESELMPNKIFAMYGQNENEDQIEKHSSHDCDEIKAIIRIICALAPFTSNLELRKHRSYMICEKIQISNNKSTETNSSIMVLKNQPSTEAFLYGYIRGNTLNVNKYIHITGLGDYKVLNVEYFTDPCPLKTERKPSVQGMEIETHEKLKSKTKAKDTELQSHPDDKVENLEGQLTDNYKPTVIGKTSGEASKTVQSKQEEEEIIDFDLNVNDNEDDLSFEDDENQLEDEEEKKRISNKHLKKAGLKYRTPEEMEFPDEVDTPIDIPARERFNKYRGLVSMKNGSWDPLENLPREYANIYSFENLKFTCKQAIRTAHEEGMKIAGSYVKITIAGFNLEDKIFLRPEVPVILSSLLDHERKLCVMHYKMKFYIENDKAKTDELKMMNKQIVECQSGFRRQLIKPIYSLDLHNGGDKVKYEKHLEVDKFYIVTVYSQLTYPNSPVLFTFPSSDGKLTMKLLASGTTIDTDSKKIILKKVILTGYPLKIKKKKAVVRYMFFSPADVNYFKPVQLATKNGLRGNITESLGTHGYMKCIFSDHIKASDTVCMNLYKRVFPKWCKESWKYKVFYGNRPDYMNYFDSQEDDEGQKKNPHQIGEVREREGDMNIEI